MAWSPYHVKAMVRFPEHYELQSTKFHQWRTWPIQKEENKTILSGEKLWHFNFSYNILLKWNKIINWNQEYQDKRGEILWINMTGCMSK